MGSFFSYNKLWIALAGTVLTVLTSVTGINFEVFGITPESIVSFVAAVLVWAVPNADFVYVEPPKTP